MFPILPVTLAGEISVGSKESQNRRIRSQSAPCPDRFKRAIAFASRIFPGVTPALQYSPKLPTQELKVKPTENDAQDIRHRRLARSGRRLKPYLTSTVAPASASFCLTVSASSLETPSFTAFGAASTRSFASFRPSAVTSRTTLMTLIF